MRVIAGKFRSRPLKSLRGEEIRPTADRLRETLFNVLCGGNPDAIMGSRWFDLFAGTGAVGIEALSRGAEHVTFVECSPQVVRLIEKNLSSLALESGFRIVRLEVDKALRQFADSEESADYIFVDPPYRNHAAYGKTMTILSQMALLAAHGQIIVEHLAKFEPGEEFGALRRYRTLTQGDSALSFYRWAG